jgi:hypothetical protein
MKTNVAPLSSIRFCSVFIPSAIPRLAHGEAVAPPILGMKTEQKRTKLSGAIFFSFFYAEAKTNTETPKQI